MSGSEAAAGRAVAAGGGRRSDARRGRAARLFLGVNMRGRSLMELAKAADEQAASARERMMALDRLSEAWVEELARAAHSDGQRSAFEFLARRAYRARQARREGGHEG